MKKTLVPIGIMLTICACSTPAEDPTEAQRLTARLQAVVASQKIIYGHEDALLYGHAWNTEQALAAGFDRSDVKDVCGSHPGLLGLDLGGIELQDSCNLDGLDFNYIRAAAVAHRERGGIVTFSWHARNPLTEGDAWDVSSAEVVASVLEGGEKHALFLSWLDRAADFLSSLKTVEGETVPVIFRPWHEHTGSWFWWGRNLCSVDEYTALWRLTHDYLVSERGLTNLVWAYSPGGGSDEAVYMERYPGDDIVDVLGVDIYQYTAPGEELADSGRRLAEQVGDALGYMERLGREHGKVIALTETGLESIPDPTWWTEVLLPAVERHPVAYVLTWRNAWDRDEHFYGPFPGAACEADFRAFAGDEKIVMLSEMNNY